MNEFRPVTNSEIRKRAWELCRANFGRILSVTFFYSLVTTLALLLGSYLAEYSVVLSIALLVITVVVLPAMEIGMIRFSADIWHDQPTGIGVLFKYFNRLPRIWGISLLIYLITIAILSPYIAMMVGELLTNGEFSILFAALTAVVLPVLAVLSIWVGIRFSLALTCIITNPELGAIDCMKTSWRASKKNAWRLYCNAFVLSLPLAVSQALIELLIPTNSTGIMIFIAGIASTLIQTLFTGYIALGQFGLAEYLLNGGDAQFPALPEPEDDDEEDDEEE